MKSGLGNYLKKTGNSCAITVYVKIFNAIDSNLFLAPFVYT